MLANRLENLLSEARELEEMPRGVMTEVFRQVVFAKVREFKHEEEMDRLVRKHMAT